MECDPLSCIGLNWVPSLTLHISQQLLHGRFYWVTLLIFIAIVTISLVNLEDIVGGIDGELLEQYARISLL